MLGQEYYTSAEIFEAEMNRIFTQRWICAGHQSEIPEKGSYFLLEIGSESIIITRDRDSTVRAFYNICRHRGARLCT